MNWSFRSDEGRGVADEFSWEPEMIGSHRGNFTVEGLNVEDRKLYEGAVRLLRQEDGVTLVEYGLVVGLIALASIVALTALKGDLATLMSAVGSQIASST